MAPIVKKLKTWGLDDYKYTIPMKLLTVFICMIVLLVVGVFAVYPSGKWLYELITIGKSVPHPYFENTTMLIAPAAMCAGFYLFVWVVGVMSLRDVGNIFFVSVNYMFFVTVLLSLLAQSGLFVVVGKYLGYHPFEFAWDHIHYLKWQYIVYGCTGISAFLSLCVTRLFTFTPSGETDKPTSGKLGSAQQAGLSYLDQKGFVIKNGQNHKNKGFAIGKLHDNYIGSEKLYNTITIAPPGSGKGVSGSIPSILDTYYNLFAFDIKGELFLTTYEDSIRKGKKPIAIDPFRVLDQFDDYIKFQVFYYDPLNPKRIDLKNKISRDRYISSLAGAMMIAGKFETPHFKDTANAILQAAIDCYLGTGKTLTNLYDEFAPLDKKGTIMVLEALQTENSSRRITGGIGMLKKVADEEAGSMLSTLYRCFDYVVSETWADFFGNTGLDIQDYITGNSDLYLIIPEDMVPRYPKVIRLMLSMLSAHFSITDVGDLHQHYPMKIDEVAQLGTLPEIPVLYEVFRSKGIRMGLYFQSIAQVDDFEKADMLKGFDIIQVFAVNDTKTIQWVQQLGGRQTVLIENRSKSESKSNPTRKGILAPGNVSKSDSTSEQEVATELYHSDVIRELDGSKQFIFKSGMRSFICDRIFYYDDKRYKGRFGINYTDPKFRHLIPRRKSKT